MGIQKNSNGIYRPTKQQFYDAISLTEWTYEGMFHYWDIELLNFKTSMIHLKSGKRIPFDGMSEDDYTTWVNY